jgi:N-formylglutamate amidohydrolase
VAAFGDDISCTHSGVGQVRPDPIDHVVPQVFMGGLIVACPHSGRFYPPELLKASRLDEFRLRRSEDAFVDLLFSNAPSAGADLLICRFARAFVDVNRDSKELDPILIRDLGDCAPVSERVKAGLGVVPRTVGEGIAIYRSLLSSESVDRRLAEVHRPWHHTIEELMEKVRARNKVALLLDCHSMPASVSGDPAADIVLGDRFGESCAPIFANTALSFLRLRGLKVARNNPFAGGYCTSRHGRPLIGYHALQIEINRSLYMVEGSFALKPEFQVLQETLTGLVSCLAQVSVQVGESQHNLA